MITSFVVQSVSRLDSFTFWKYLSLKKSNKISFKSNRYYRSQATDKKKNKLSRFNNQIPFFDLGNFLPVTAWVTSWVPATKIFRLDWICGWKTSIYESSQSKHADFCLIIDAQKQFYGNKNIFHIEPIYTIYNNFVVIYSIL